MKMGKKQMKTYVAPQVKVVSFTIERGFLGSGEHSLHNALSLEGLSHGSSDGVNDNYDGFFGPRATQN